MASITSNYQDFLGSMAASQNAATSGMLPPSDLRPGENFLDTLQRQYAGERNASPTPPASGATSISAGNSSSAQGDGPLLAAAQLHARARKAAEGLVANALILPVLKQLRQDPFGKNTIFSPGTGEKTFGPQFDMEIADRIAQSPAMAATQVLTQRIERRETQSTVSANMVNRPGVDVHG